MKKSGVFIILVLVMICAVAGVWYAKSANTHAAPRPPAPQLLPEANAYAFVEAFGNAFSLDERHERLHEIRDYSYYAFPGGEQTMSNQQLAAAFVPKFINIQNSFKVLRVETTLLLFQGKRDEALEMLADSIYLAHLIANSNTMIGRMIGVAAVAISSSGMELYALNACETAEDCEGLWKVLEELQRAIPPDYYGEKFKPERAPFTSRPNFKEAEARQLTAETRFQLVRTAAAAWRNYLKDGKFPTTPKDFAPLLPGGPPSDPFGKAPLRFREDAAKKEFLCYSIGPDLRDNGGATNYDPSNGTFSSGDIVTRVPRQRQYPFPRQGVHAATARELLAQFPNGLPLDPFADTKGRGLNVSNTQPVMIYSFGPDCNQAQADAAGAAYSVQPQYDPANGTTSTGDIFIQIKP